MSYDVWLVLLGAGIGLVCSIVGIVVQHRLSLREERIRGQWEIQKEQWQAGKRALLRVSKTFGHLSEGELEDWAMTLPLEEIEQYIKNDGLLKEDEQEPSD